MILTFLFERLYFDLNFDQNSIQFFLHPLYFESNFEKKIDLGQVTTSPAEDSEADGGTPVVPGPAQPCPPCQVRGTCGGTAEHLLLIHSVEMHLISIKVLIEMYFILIKILKNALFLQTTLF